MARATTLQTARKTLWSVDAAKNIVFGYVVLRYLLATSRHLRARGIVTSVRELYFRIARRVFGLIVLLPSAQKQLRTELGKTEKELRSKLAPYDPSMPEHHRLPSEGLSGEAVEAELQQLTKLHAADWQHGRVSGAVYHGHGEVTGRQIELGPIIESAMHKFMLSNPLHPDVFPGVRKMEAEVIRMCLNMYNAPEGAAGATTSGGTESILMACLAYRTMARSKGITEPELVIPKSAHAAFDKAGHYFGIKIHHIPVDPITRQVNLRRVARAINVNTIALVGSAITFSDGIADDIPGLSRLALKHKIGLHVDCCLGSFIVPFIERAGFPFVPFDFRVPGVTSISCDTHKYGFAPKGSSVVLYRDAKWRSQQYFVQTDWPGGLYASPTIAGSRPGALIAGTWASMLAMGDDGYLDSAKEVVGACRRIIAGLRAMPNVSILGNPMGSVVAFSTSDVSIYAVGDIMSKRGWHLNGLQHPPALHLCCTRPTALVVDDFLHDVRESIAEAKAATTGGKAGNMVLLYGLGSSAASGPMLVTKVAHMFLDTLTHVPAPSDAAPDTSGEAHSVAAGHDLKGTATAEALGAAG